jgi:hypothetical protein
MLFLVRTLLVFFPMFVNFVSMRFHKQVTWKLWILEMGHHYSHETELAKFLRQHLL